MAWRCIVGGDIFFSSHIFLEERMMRHERHGTRTVHLIRFFGVVLKMTKKGSTHFVGTLIIMALLGTRRKTPRNPEFFKWETLRNAPFFG